MDGLKISALICCFISIALLLIILASPNWVEARDYAGLWKACNDTVCNSLGMRVQGYVHATRAFLIIGLIIGVMSFVDLCTLFCHSYFVSSAVTKYTSKASFFAGLSVVLALSIFTGGYFVSRVLVGSSLGWTYGLGWVPGPLFFVTDWLVYRIHTHVP